MMKKCVHLLKHVRVSELKIGNVIKDKKTNSRFMVRSPWVYYDHGYLATDVKIKVQEINIGNFRIGDTKFLEYGGSYSSNKVQDMGECPPAAQGI